MIADTHGVLRPAAVAALQGCEAILHAGDVGRPEVLEALGRVAPVRAIRGNVDRWPWAEGLPATLLVEAGGVAIHLVHNLRELELDPVAAGVGAVVSGHTHRAASAWRDGVLYFNPGGAGPRRFSLPLSVGLLTIEGGRVEARVVALEGPTVF